MLEIFIGLGIILAVFGLVSGIMILAEGGYDYPKSLTLIARVVVALIVVALFLTVAYVIGAEVLAEWGGG